MNKYKFKATLIENDSRTGFKKGTVFHPKGLYYQKKQVVIVGNTEDDSTVRIAFPSNIVDIEITTINPSE